MISIDMLLTDKHNGKQPSNTSVKYLGSFLDFKNKLIKIPDEKVETYLTLMNSALTNKIFHKDLDTVTGMIGWISNIKSNSRCHISSLVQITCPSEFEHMEIGTSFPY